MGRTANEVSHNFSPIKFSQSFSAPPIFLGDIQTANGLDPANLRYRKPAKGAIEVQLDEEQSKDKEVEHGSEKVGFVLLEPTEGW